MASRDLRRVVALAYDGLGTFEFGIVVELFGLRRIGLGVPWYQFEVCSLERGPIRAAGGIRVLARRGLRAFDQAGTIVIPGWTLADEPPPPALIRALRRAHADGARLVSICSGVFLLAATGLLDGKRVTAHWRHAERLIARRLVMPPHREGGQAQYVRESGRSPLAGGLAPVLACAQEHLAKPLSIQDLANKAALSARTFARRFREQTGTTPHRWLTHQRLFAAQRRLETTEESIDQIAEAVGLQTAATLRQHFSRPLGTTPTGYRRRFRLLPLS